MFGRSLHGALVGRGHDMVGAPGRINLQHDIPPFQATNWTMQLTYTDGNQPGQGIYVSPLSHLVCFGNSVLWPITAPGGPPPK